MFIDPREGILAEATEIIRRPDPTLGWTGDTDMFVVGNRLEDRWEVWREDEDGRFRMVMRQREPGQRLDMARVIRSLVERDTFLRNNSHEIQMQKLIEANEREHAARSQAMQEGMAETMAKVAHAIVTQDEKAHHAYVRPLTVGGALKAAVTELPD